MEDAQQEHGLTLPRVLEKSLIISFYDLLCALSK